MTTYQYRTVELRQVKRGDEIRSASGKTWLPPVRHATMNRPVSEPGIVSVWWGTSAAERRPDWESLGTTTVRIRRPSNSLRRTR